MKWSNAFIPTLKETPKDAECISHKLLLRAGYIRMLSSGIYIFLPLAYKSILKIGNIIREEMNRIGAQEILMPSLNPIEIWDATGRNEIMGSEMLRVKDRKNKLFALAPTHEEIIATLASGEIRSYKELPQIWYQIQTKFRDEPRPRFGLLRVREFFMKDSYTLASTKDELDESYQLHRQAYIDIFKRCGLKFVICGASSGSMGGKQSEEFMVQSNAGEDFLVSCPKCKNDYNREIAPSNPSMPTDKTRMEFTEYFHTPEQRTIDEVSAFLRIPPSRLVKSLLYIRKEDNTPVMFLIRGDYDLSESKITEITGAVRPAEPDEVKKITGADIGFIGPFGLKNVRLVIDNSIPEEYLFATGANRNDYHTVGRNITELGIEDRYDIHIPLENDTCPVCNAKLEMTTALELGHIFKLGTRYSSALDASFLDPQGKKQPIIMGSYGIGLGRVLVAGVESFSDKDGIVLPISIAPYEICITPLQMDNAKITEFAMKLHDKLSEMGIDVLLDDREVSPGFKFKDADLIGIPLRVTLGARNFEQGNAELYNRWTKKSEVYPIGEILDRALELRDEMYNALV